MLDGASRIGEVVAAAAADGQPAVGITDHGNMYGVLPLYEAARDAGVKPVLGMEGYFTNTSRFDRPKRAEHEIFHLTLLAETERGLPQPHQGHEHGVPRRLLLQAPHRLGAARARTTRASPRPPDASVGSCRSSSCRTSRRRGAGRGGAVPGDLRARALLRRAAGPRHRRRRQGASARCSTSRASSARRCSRRTTATTRTRNTRRRTTRCCACRPARCRATRSGSSSTATTSTSRARPRCATCSAEVPEACDNTLLIAERAEVELEFGQAILPVVPRSRRARRELVPARADDARAPRSATANDRALHVRRAHRVRARRHQVDGVLRVLPRRLGPRALREVAQHPGRARAGERGRFVRRVLPAHRRHRPDQVRPPVRAVPQPGPQADARHRHGLRLPLPRRDDPYAAQRYGHDHVAQIVTFSTIKARAAVRDAARCSAIRTRSATRSPS